MKTYLVGGAVRDSLLGLSGSDRDWVVVGATPEQMVALGYVPVGKDFPVFLHPQTQEEYALARTERKTAPGYKGFVVHAAPDVTLQQDLARRDLTINAMALDPDEPQVIIDPYGGQDDLHSGVLRHVTEAFREDPVRILRLARFAARLGHFEVAPATLALASEMVQAGEVDALVPERVWQELERGLLAQHPSRMAHVLMACGAWSRLWPELNGCSPQHQAAMQRLDQNTAAGQSTLTLGQRWAMWCHGATPDQVTAIGQRYRVPHAVSDMALGWATFGATLHGQCADAPAACKLLHRLDAPRRPERARELIQLAVLNSSQEIDIEHARQWADALDALLSVDAKAANRHAIEQGLSGPAIGEALMQAQTRAIAVRFGG